MVQPSQEPSKTSARWSAAHHVGIVVWSAGGSKGMQMVPDPAWQPRRRGPPASESTTGLLHRYNSITVNTSKATSCHRGMIRRRLRGGVLLSSRSCRLRGGQYCIRICSHHRRESAHHPRGQRPLLGDRCSALLTAHGDRQRSELDRYRWSFGTPQRSRNLRLVLIHLTLGGRPEAMMLAVVSSLARANRPPVSQDQKSTSRPRRAVGLLLRMV